MILLAYQQTFWLEHVPATEVTQAQGLFKANYLLEGSDWLSKVDPEARKVFSELGLRRLRELDINLPHLGGKARAKAARRDEKGRFTREVLPD